jgi:electron transfer flavoprotein beta subunit
VVSKVFGPTPRSEKADMMTVADTSLNDVTLNLLDKIFTQHPMLEQEIVDHLPPDRKVTP